MVGSWYLVVMTPCNTMAQKTSVFMLQMAWFMYKEGMSNFQIIWNKMIRFSIITRSCPWNQIVIETAFITQYTSFCNKSLKLTVSLSREGVTGAVARGTFSAQDLFLIPEILDSRQISGPFFIISKKITGKWKFARHPTVLKSEKYIEHDQKKIHPKISRAETSVLR